MKDHYRPFKGGRINLVRKLTTISNLASLRICMDYYSAYVLYTVADLQNRSWRNQISLKICVYYILLIKLKKYMCFIMSGIR